MDLRCCLGALLLAGCQSLTGLPGSSASFSCKAPDGVACSSVSGVHANLMAHNLPFQRRGEGGIASTPMPAGLPLAMPATGDPLHKDPRILRIWIAPWVDDDGTLHDQQYLYTQVDQGHWLIGEYRKQVNDAIPRRPEHADASVLPGRSSATGPKADKPAPATLANVHNDAHAQNAARTVIDTAQRPGDHR